MTSVKWLLVLLFAAWATSAQAYIGPGIGAGVIVTALAAIGSLFLGLFAILYYPIKRALKKRRRPTDATTEEVN